MKKISNNILKILFGALCFVMIAAKAYAICDEADIKNNIAKSIDTTVAQLRTSLEAYNRATKNFEASCGEITDAYRGKPLAFDLRTLQQALSFDKAKFAYLTDMSQYADTDINWGQVPTNQEKCENLRIEAWTELDRYTNYYTKAIVVFGVAEQNSNLPVSCVCPEGSNEQVCTAYTSAKIEEQKTIDKCDTFATYLSSLSSCPLCPLFQVVLNTDAKIADIAWRSLSKALQNVVMVFFLVYLAIETLKIVSNVAGSNMASYLKSILVLGTKVTFTYFLLSNSSYIYGYFVSPVIQAGLDMGTSLISISSSQASICLANNANVDFVTTPGNVLDAGLLDSIMRTVRCYGHTATIMPAVGKGLICHGWSGLLPNFSMWFSGILFYLFGLIIWLVVSFYLIDCTVQLGLVCGILPILVACWPFKFTEKYSIKGVQLIMNTFFNYVMLGIVLLLGVEIVDFATGKKSGSFEAFMNAMNNNNLEELKKIASLDGIEILILIICCIFAFKLIATTNGLADKFSKGSGMNIASKLGGVAASAGVAAVATGANAGSKIGEAALDELGVTGKFTQAGDSIKNFMLGGASSFGKTIGLGKYQPQAKAEEQSQTKASVSNANVGNDTPAQSTEASADVQEDVQNSEQVIESDSTESGNPQEQTTETGSVNSENAEQQNASENTSGKQQSFLTRRNGPKTGQQRTTKSGQRSFLK